LRQFETVPDGKQAELARNRGRKIGTKWEPNLSQIGAQFLRRKAYVRGKKWLREMARRQLAVKIPAGHSCEDQYRITFFHSHWTVDSRKWTVDNLSSSGQPCVVCVSHLCLLEACLWSERCKLRPQTVVGLLATNERRTEGRAKAAKDDPIVAPNKWVQLHCLRRVALSPRRFVALLCCTSPLFHFRSSDFEQSPIGPRSANWRLSSAARGGPIWGERKRGREKEGEPKLDPPCSWEAGRC